MSEKLLPQNAEAELATLGSMIIDPEVIVLLATFLQPEDFYRDGYRTIYEVMLFLYQQRQAADLITICDELARRNKLDEVGGPGAISSLINQVPTSINAEYYARIVTRNATLRRLIQAAADIAAVAYEEIDADLALEHAEQRIFALGQRGQQTDFTPIGAALRKNLDTLSAIQQTPGALVGVPTGFSDLDAPLGGLQRSDLVILAARPGTGKTALALNIAAHAVYQHQRRVAFFSLEMGEEQLSLRLLSMQSRINQQRLRMGWVEDDEWEKIVTTSAYLAEGSLWIEGTGELTVSTLRSKVRRLQAQQGVDLIIVDYLQLLHATVEGKRISHREQEIAAISRELKGIAKELQVPVLALAQLSRAVEGRQSKVPQLSDLRESGAIENDADVVLFIYRDELYNVETTRKGIADIIIAKHRNGPVGEVSLRFDATQTRFFNLEVSPPTDEEE